MEGLPEAPPEGWGAPWSPVPNQHNTEEPNTPFGEPLSLTDTCVTTPLKLLLDAACNRANLKGGAVILPPGCVPPLPVDDIAAQYDFAKMKPLDVKSSSPLLGPIFSKESGRPYVVKCTQHPGETRFINPGSWSVCIGFGTLPETQTEGFWHVMPYQGDDLFDILLRGPLTLEEVIVYTLELLKTIHGLNIQGLNYTDPKLENITIYGNFLTLCDLESVRPRGEDGPGTLGYIAPETKRDGSLHCTLPATAYKVGIILFSMCTRRMPGHCSTLPDSLQTSAGGWSLPETLRFVIMSLLCDEPEARMTIEQALEMLKDLETSQTIENMKTFV